MATKVRVCINGEGQMVEELFSGVGLLIRPRSSFGGRRKYDVIRYHPETFELIERITRFDGKAAAIRYARGIEQSGISAMSGTRQ